MYVAVEVRNAITLDTRAHALTSTSIISVSVLGVLVSKVLRRVRMRLQVIKIQAHITNTEIQ